MSEKKLLLSIPEDLHGQLKVAAAIRGVSVKSLAVKSFQDIVKDTLPDWVQQSLEKHDLRGRKTPWT